MANARPFTVIVDYGMGNLFSIARAVNRLGGSAEISSDAEKISAADRVILPGVGAFGDGMKEFRGRGLAGSLERFVRSGKPLLGICLGMQLFMAESEEFGIHEGLGYIPGKVKRLGSPVIDGRVVKVPHVGWNRLHAPCNGWRGKLFNKISKGSYVYFSHSYAAVPESSDAILAETVYGNERFCSAVSRDNLFGCQFHPEVSGEAGRTILENFLFHI